MLIRLTICSLWSMSFCYFGVSHFGFRGGTVILIALVPGHCLFGEVSSSPGCLGWAALFYCGTT